MCICVYDNKVLITQVITRGFSVDKQVVVINYLRKLSGGMVISKTSACNTSLINVLGKKYCF